MALISLFFQTKAKLDQMELDCSMTESHEAAAVVSENEIEDGSSVSDNVVLSPLRLTLEGVVSKTPLGAAALIGSAASAAAGAVGAAQKAGAAQAIATIGLASVGGLVANSFGPDGPKSRAPADVLDYLHELRAKRLPFSVLTALKLYDNMILTNLSVPRSVATVNILRFTATLQQVKLVKSETVDLGSASSLGGAAGATKALGTQAVSEAASKTGSNASILYGIFGGGL
jgi:hypothetical protein